MNNKVTKNIAILTEYIARFLRMQILFWEWYIGSVGFFFLCGFYKNTRLGHFFWGINNNDWILFLSNILNGKISSYFQMTMISLICIVCIGLSLLKYFLHHYKTTGFSYSYDEYCFANNILSSIGSLIFVYSGHGQISIDTIAMIFFSYIILYFVSYLLLKLTRTDTAFFRLK